MVIRAVFFSRVALAVAALAACGPDLDRVEGRLDVQVLGVPAAAEEVEIQVRAAGGASPFRVLRAPDAARVGVRAPVGDATVEARALGAGTQVLVRATQAAEVVEGDRKSVV